jgi:parvulin-like peptidyl-prolyl isomerase
MLGNVFQDVAESDVERLFGRAFADTVMQLDTARWVGPVESGYGLHLVFVRDRVAGVVPPLSDVVVEVRRDVLAERQRTLNEEVYQRFRERYDVRVDWPEWVEPDTAVAERP